MSSRRSLIWLMTGRFGLMTGLFWLITGLFCVKQVVFHLPNSHEISTLHRLTENMVLLTNDTDNMALLCKKWSLFTYSMAMRSRRSIICLYSLFLWTTLESPYVNICVYVYSHDPSIFMTWLTRRCNLTHSYVRHDSFVCDMISLYLWYDAFVCVTWRICVCDMTHPCVVWLIHVSFVCGTCRIHIVGRDARVCGTWRIRTSDVTHSYVGRESYVWSGAFVRVTWRIRMCDTTHTWMSHVTHTDDSYHTYE